MRISVIIPALNEGALIAGAVQAVQAQGPHEVIVVDGGSSDDTAAAAQAAGARVVAAPRGRASQMNAGARRASGDVLLFLHADVRLPGDGLMAVERALQRPRYVGGAFRLRLDTRRPLLRVIAWLSDLRTHVSSILMGDRAIFVRRSAFDALSGFRTLPLMEDVDFGHRLHRYGGVARLPLFVTASARRWEARGPIRTVVLMFCLVWLWEAGVSPERLTWLYPPVSTPGGGPAAGARDALVVFARAPRLGQVKTRLAAKLGDDAALDIYRSLGRRVAETCGDGSLVSLHRVLAFTPADAGEEMEGWLGGGWDLQAQAEGDLGRRMLTAFEESAARGARATVVIGTDCVAFGPGHIEAALAAARKVDVVLGPARDGGYWLIAMAHPAPEVFRDVPWGGDQVLTVTLDRAREAGLSVKLLETLPDVDRPEDLALAGLAVSSHA